MTKFYRVRKTITRYLTQPIVHLLARTPITPNIISLFGFLVTLGAAVLIITEHLFTAGFVVLIAGFFDTLDGELARLTNQSTKFGAILDSTLDRLSEAVLLLGILVFYAKEQSITGILVVGVALFGSLLVSYIRARAEALGLECQVGLFTRVERVVVLAFGLLLSQINYTLMITLAIIAIFSFITAGQRLIYVWQQIKNN
ncbi:CDP-alcohol phosphatidyltransferase family protein [Chloroflexota bacterium]